MEDVEDGRHSSKLWTLTTRNPLLDQHQLGIGHVVHLEVRGSSLLGKKETLKTIKRSGEPFRHERPGQVSFLFLREVGAGGRVARVEKSLRSHVSERDPQNTP